MELKQWLPEKLSQDIWDKKYRHNKESLDEWFKRVSGDNEDMENLMKEKKFLFAGRTLSNRGLNDGSYSNCFTPGNKVLTRDGYKNIEDIKVGEYVLTKDNSYQIVNKVFKQKYEGDLITFKSPNLIDTIKCTPNHRFLTNRGWETAEVIADIVKYQSPKNYKLRNSFNKIETEDVKIDLFKLLIPICERLTADSKSIWIGRPDNKKLYDNAIVVNRYITIDKDLKYVFGRYLGDGSITNNKTLNRKNYIFQIVFNAETEAEDYIRCKNILTKHFGDIVTDNSNEGQNTAVLKINSNIIGEFFNLYCGKKENKQFPALFKNDINIALGLLDSDGSINKTGGIRIWLKSNILMEGLYNCLINNNLPMPKYKNGVNNKIYTINKLEIPKGAAIKLIPLMTKKYEDNRTSSFMPKTKQFYEVGENEVYLNIWDIQTISYIGNVYNLSVEINHDYIVNGVNVHNCYSAGFVQDSLEDIMAVNTKLAMTYKAQGGQGASLSKIRPKGTLINGRYKSDGIVPIMEMYNTTTESIIQGGSRKGALLLSINIKHKEAPTFITIKSDLTKINKANLSVEIDDDFMKAVKTFYKTGEVIILDIKEVYGSQTIEYSVTPIELYKLLMKQAHLSAEPGVIFTNRFRNYNSMEFVEEYKIENCNPCGEQPLPKDGACNLGSFNVSAYVVDPFTPKASIDLFKLQSDIYIAVREMDNLIDENLNNHATKDQQHMSASYRNIGIGIMGFGDMFIKLGLKYGETHSVQLTNLIMRTLFIGSIKASIALAKQKGAYPGYKPEVFDASILKGLFTLAELAEFKVIGIRNASLLSIAPTGTLATMLNISAGIEPNFALSFTRKTESLGGNEAKYYKVDANIVKEFIEIRKTEVLPDYFSTAHTVSWKKRIDLQAAAQQYVDTAISSTINLPNNISIEEVEQLYLYAWEKGIKGITIFRDGCRDGILSLGNIYSKNEKNNDNFFKRPEILEAKVVHFINEETSWIAFVGMKEEQPFEIFSGPANIEVFPVPKSIVSGQIIKVKQEGKKSRYDFRYTDSYGYQNTLGGLSRIFSKEHWNYARLISGLLRNKVKTESVVEIIQGMYDSSKSLHSWRNGVIRALKSFIKDGTKVKEKCPDCAENLSYINGCKTCTSCGWSKCD